MHKETYRTIVAAESTGAATLIGIRVWALLESNKDLTITREGELYTVTTEDGQVFSGNPLHEALRKAQED